MHLIGGKQMLFINQVDSFVVACHKFETDAGKPKTTIETLKTKIFVEEANRCRRKWKEQMDPRASFSSYRLSFANK